MNESYMTTFHSISKLGLEPFSGSNSGISRCTFLLNLILFLLCVYSDFWPNHSQPSILLVCNVWIYWIPIALILYVGSLLEHKLLIVTCKAFLSAPHSKIIQVSWSFVNGELEYCFSSQKPIILVRNKCPNLN